MKVSDYQSLLAWNPLRLCRDGLVYHLHGMLAEYPDQFPHRIRSERPFDGFRCRRTPYTTTNKGLQIKLPLFRIETSATLFMACWIARREARVIKGSGVCVPLVCFSADGMQFGRVSGLL